MAKQRLKSTSKGGQSVKARANESKGARKKELNKIARVDHQDYENAPAYVRKKIRKEYANKKGKAREKNKGEYI